MSRHTADDTRFTDWLARHGGIPRGLSRIHADNTADSADLYQEMLLQLWRSISKFDGRARAKTWIYRVCLNTALNWRRGRRRREARIVVESVPADFVASPGDGPAELEERREKQAALVEALRGLSAADRSLMALALNDLSNREIGEVLGMTANHVGVALLRARRRLKTRMKGLTDDI